MNSPIKWHGGKHYLASKIVQMMPDHIHYVEPFAGSLAVLFAKDPEGVSEVVNDIDQELYGFWHNLRESGYYERFLRMSQATPFSEDLWNWAERVINQQMGENVSVERAWAFFVLCRQSLAGRMKSFTGITKTRTRRGMNGEVSAWLSAIEGLPEVHNRLKRVLILNRDGLDVIHSQDGEQTLQYLDPPYPSDTRTSPEVYRYEFTNRQHEEMLQLVNECKSKFIISGYDNELYAKYLKEWNKKIIEIPNHASSAKSKKVMQEVLWFNY